MKNSIFLKEFLQLSDYHTLLFIGVLVCLFAVIYKCQKKMKFQHRMILGMILGLVLGVVIQAAARFPDDPAKVEWISELSNWYGLVGNGYMDLLKMLVVPLIFFSIVRVIMNMQGENIGRLASKTIGMLIGTTLIAATIGAIIAAVMKLGTGMAVEQSEEAIREVTSITSTLRGLLPSNVIKSMAEGNVIAVVIFAVFIGMAIRRQSKRYADVIAPFVAWVEAFYKIILSVAMTIIKYMPYAVVAMLSGTIMSRGIGVLLSVSKFVIALYFGVILMLLVHMLIAMTVKVSPLQYLKKGMKPLVFAFTSRSSMGTLPVLIDTLKEEFKVDEGIATFVGSFGANMGMNGCAGLYAALVTVMVAQMSGTPLDLSFYIMLIIVISISSFGIAGLPGTATIAISVVISGMGMGEYFPLVGAVIAIDPILDMARTMLNVSGTMVSALVVEKTEKKKKKV